MATITLSAPLRDALLGHGDEAELKGIDGRTVGYFVAPEAYRKMQYAHAARLVTDDELQASRSQPGGRTSAELLQRFGLAGD